MATTKTSNHIIAISGRLSFPNIFEAKAFDQSQKAKFSATLIMDKKKDAASIAKVQAAIDALTAEKFKGKKLPDDKLCLKDGSLKEDKQGYGPNVMFLTASSETRPTVVDRDKTPLVAQDNKPVAGNKVNMSVEIWAQDHKQFGKRMNASLRAVQFVEDDGVHFGGGVPVDAESELPDVDEVEV